jgi:hypothetical protein
MKKKFYVPIAIGLLTALIGGVVVSGVAFANETSMKIRRHKTKTVIGQIVDVNQMNMKIQTVQEKELAISITEETTIRDQEGNQLSTSDLTKGKWVRVIFGKANQDELVAKAIILLPDDFDPSNYERIHGLVTKVNLSSQTVFLKAKEKDEVSVGFDENTRYFGAADNFSEIEEGMIAGIIAEKTSDENYLAKVIRLRFPTIRIIGKVTDVEANGNTFKLVTRRGEKELNVTVDENTRFKSRDGSLQGIEDLNPDTFAVVIAKRSDLKDEENSQLTALAVLAGTGEQLPNFEVKIRGKVVEKAGDKITLENPKGEQFIVVVNTDTKFKSRGDAVQNLEQIEIGMQILIGGKKLDSGDVQAELIVVLPSRK